MTEAAGCRICGGPIIGRRPMAAYCSVRCRRVAEFARRKLPGRRISLEWWAGQARDGRGRPQKYAAEVAARLAEEVAELERRAGLDERSAS